MELLDFEDYIYLYAFQLYQWPLKGIRRPLHNNVLVIVKYEQDLMILNPNTILLNRVHNTYKLELELLFKKKKKKKKNNYYKIEKKEILLLKFYPNYQ